MATRVGDIDKRRPERPLLPWIVGGLVVVAIAVAALAGALREPANVAPDSPEGVVQAYLRAVLSRDHAAAVGYLTEEAARRCPASAFRTSWVPEDVTADLEEVSVNGGEARVRVHLQTPVAPLPLDSQSSTELFLLVREDDAWRLTGEPWPLTACTEPS